MSTPRTTEGRRCAAASASEGELPCYHPIPGYVKPGGGWTSSPMLGYRDRPMKVACGQCIGCRLERSRQWAIRCHHEASLWEDNCFITLTYDGDRLPEDRGLHHRDYQLFMKRLRKVFGPGVRYFMAGEYGTWCRRCSQHPERCSCDKTIEGPGRPHFHALMFNLDFQDKKFFRMLNGHPLYTSAKLERLWPHGFSSVGAATFASAAYVARYVTKKMNGRKAEEVTEVVNPVTGEVHLAKHYEWIDPETGRCHSRAPEYCQPSRGGRDFKGIGRAWLDKYKGDVWPDDFIVIDGRKMKVPRFYERAIQVDDPELYEEVKRRRKIENQKHAENQTPERLAVREKVQKARFARLPRKLD